jgi:hypothetical protein
MSNPVEKLAQSLVESQGFQLTHELRNKVMLRIGHAGVNEESPEVVKEVVKHVLASTKELTPLAPTGTLRTASVRSCPRCSGSMVVARISTDTECDYCPGCRVTEPR